MTWLRTKIEDVSRFLIFAVSFVLFHLGVKPGISTGICGGLTVGYGKLDGNGYWQFPLERHLWPDWARELDD